MQVVFVGKHHALAVDVVGKRDFPLLGYKAQHAHRALDHGRYGGGDRLFGNLAVKARQAQQVFRNARQPLRLMPDIADKLAHGACIHVLRL